MSRDNQNNEPGYCAKSAANVLVKMGDKGVEILRYASESAARGEEARLDQKSAKCIESNAKDYALAEFESSCEEQWGQLEARVHQEKNEDTTKSTAGSVKRTIGAIILSTAAAVAIATGVGYHQLNSSQKIEYTVEIDGKEVKRYGLVSRYDMRNHPMAVLIEMAKAQDKEGLDAALAVLNSYKGMTKEERDAADRRIAAEKEAARLAAEQERARLAQAAQQEAARLAAEKDAAKLAAEQERARLKAEQERERQRLRQEKAATDASLRIEREKATLLERAQNEERERREAERQAQEIRAQNATRAGEN